VPHEHLLASVARKALLMMTHLFHARGDRAPRQPVVAAGS